MEQEFSLQEYIAIISRRRRLIFLVAIISALVAGVIAFLIGPIYEGMVIVDVAKGQFFWGFGSGVGSTIDPKADLRWEVNRQVKSVEVASLVIQRLGDRLPDDRRDPEELVKAPKGKWVRNSFTGYELIVRDKDARIAALLANTYADVISQRMEDLYGLGDLTVALEKARADLVTAVNREAAFKTQTGMRINLGSNMAVSANGDVLYAGLALPLQQLVLKNAALADYQESIDRLQLVLSHAERAQADGKGLDSLPLELLRTPTLTARGHLTPEKTAAFSNDLPGLVTALRAELQAVQQIHGELKAQATEIQRLITTNDVEIDRLEKDSQAKQLTVDHLETKKQELITKQLVEGRLVAMTTPSEIPESPASLHPVIIAIFGLIIGGLAGILMALAMDGMRAWLPVLRRTPAQQPVTG